MDELQIFDQLSTIVRSINGGAVVKENTALVGEYILDSLEFMNYLTKVEEAFKINISDSDIKEHQLGILINMVKYISSEIDKN
jgi:acyl carrier protein